MRILGYTFWNKNKLRERTLYEIKDICKILFIDDKSFPIIDILKTNGWRNIQKIKDVDALEQQEVREAHILFVDIQGVGKKLKLPHEGLDLIVALKHKYPNKKVIAYSAEDQGQVQAFHQGIEIADSRISKNAKSYEFEFKLEKFSKELFSLSECINRVKEILIKELGNSPETVDIINKIEKVGKGNEITSLEVSKIFNLQNAANLAQVLQIFYSA